MARFDLENYIDVSERIEQFYEKYPEGRIITDLLNTDRWDGKQSQFIVQAHLYDGPTLLANGLAEESFGGSGPNATSALENAETSAIGRACANLGFQTTRDGKRQRPSRQEMDKVNRGAQVTPLDTLREKLSAKFGAVPQDIKFFLEGKTGKSKTSDLDESEIAGLLVELG